LGEEVILMQENQDGLELKIMRIKTGIKAIDVAISLGWSPSKLSLIENGRIKASEETIMQIKEAIIQLTKGN